MLTTEIDPVEALLATLGVRPLVSKDVPFLTKAKLGESVKLGDRIEALARDLCRDEVAAVKLYTVDYTTTLRELYEEWQPEQIEKLAKALQENAGAMMVDFQAKAKDVVTYLQGIFPRSTYETFLGAANVVPNDLAIYAFESVLEVLDEWTRVFTFIGQGALTKRQATAFRLVYPTISKAIDEALLSAAAAEKTKVKAYEVPPAAEVGIARWQGRPAVKPATSAQLAATAAKPKEPGPPVPAATTPKATVQSKEALTSSQKAAFGPTK